MTDNILESDILVADRDIRKSFDQSVSHPGAPVTRVLRGPKTSSPDYDAFCSISTRDDVLVYFSLLFIPGNIKIM